MRYRDISILNNASSPDYGLLRSLLPTFHPIFHPRSNRWSGAFNRKFPYRSARKSATIRESGGSQLKPEVRRETSKQGRSRNPEQTRSILPVSVYIKLTIRAKLVSFAVPYHLPRRGIRECAEREREREGKVFESENSFADALSRKSGEEGRIWVVVSV